ncbi:serine/threonine phosphatase [Myxacorys almedinensis]|uniref:Serine/threonine phosphatase n=1 Tax=Myxacorys almedinensis A TaxID=2690445 RepID=A0A8J8CJK9_9CYAN|nr:serine/threonine phosphatase [Myxacorys almedinensis]NDJ19098.1 serine/threonine phosphatase [Myxacorys almedinensis A]
MLVCSQCQSENSDTHKFCQVCGTSLTEKSCPNCGASVLLSEEKCSQCGTVTGTILRAIIALHGFEDRLAQKGIPVLQHLDPACRYRVVSGFQTADAGIEGLVLDTRPLQPPLFDEFKPLSQLANPYLHLPELHQILPGVYDTWQQGDQDILLLEERSHLLQLTEFMVQTNDTIPMLQILHWFYEMVDLWELLDPWRMRQSLLTLPNLRLDEDQVLCLQRLYRDPPTELTLKNLGTIWQSLLSHLSQTQSADLHLLLADVLAEAVVTVEDLRSRLKLLAQELQDTPLPAMIMSESSSNSPSESMSELPLPHSDAERQETTTTPLEAEDELDDLPTVVLPMQLFSLDDAGRTDIGRQRNHNEDCFSIDTQVTKTHLPSGKVVQARGLYVLCDGMGGHSSGEVASQLAADTLRTYFQQHWQKATETRSAAKLPPVEVIREAIWLANKAIYDVNQTNARSGSGRMGTTMVMVLLQDTEMAIAHVGDSRLYRYTRKRGLEQLTLDHEVGQREILRGVEPEIAYGRPDAYQLTQALGPRDEHFVQPDVQYFEINEDAVIILASDGLTDNNLLEKHWQTHVDPLVSSHANLDQGVGKLIDLANQHNGHDNITAIAIRAKVRPNLEHLR